jgi:hypothetical protein
VPELNRQYHLQNPEFNTMDLIFSHKPLKKEIVRQTRKNPTGQYKKGHK